MWGRKACVWVCLVPPPLPPPLLPPSPPPPPPRWASLSVPRPKGPGGSGGAGPSRLLLPPRGKLSDAFIKGLVEECGEKRYRGSREGGTS